MAMWSNLFHNRSGAAAAEMALVTPLLMTIMFGSFEMGNYFYANHIIAKAVRDGARYASRRSFSEYSCPSTISSDVIDKTRDVTRTGQIVSGGTPHLWYWTNVNTITVTIRCNDNTVDNYKGIYDGMAGVPIVEVNAVVSYGSLFSLLGFNTTGLNISAKSEVPVMGV
jgi:Flp pilus assembly protein TadG